MKITRDQRSSLFLNNFSGFSSVLFYGDESMVAFESKRLLNNFSYITHINDPSCIISEVKQMSIWREERKILLFSGAQDKHVSILEKAWDVLGDSFLIITSGSLSVNSKLRVLSEKHQSVAVIGCYSDTIQTLKVFVSEYFKKKRYTITQDAKQALIYRLSSNRLETIRTLEKLTLFVGEERMIQLYDVEQVVDCYSEGQLVLHAFSGKVSSLYLLDHLKREMHAIGIIRKLSNHARRLLSLLEIIQETGSFTVACERIAPKIFFFDKPFFQEQIKRWNFSALQSLLKLCFTCELLIKKGERTDTLCDILVMRILKFSQRPGNGLVNDRP